MAHIRQPRPDSGLGFQVKVLKLFNVVPSEGGSGRALPTETKVESGTSQSKSGTSVNLSNSEFVNFR